MAAHLVVLPQNQIASASNIDGLPDTSFAVDTPTSGTRIETSTTNSVYATAINFPDESVIVAGSYVDTTTSKINYLLKSFNAAGVENTTFGQNFNSNSLNSTPHDEFGLKHLTTQSVNSVTKLVAVGYEIIPSTSYSEVLMRFNLDGTLDTTFGTSGKVRLSQQSVNGIAIQKSDGKIVVSLSSSNGSGNPVVKRFLPAGQQDTEFGPLVGLSRTGEANVGDTNRTVWVSQIGLDKNEKIVVLGSSSQNSGPSYPYFLRLEKTGIRDSSFGTNGEFVFSDVESSGGLSALDFQGDGKIVAAGYESKFDSASSSFKSRQLIIRVNENGVLDSTFGSAGRFLNTISATDSNSVTGIQNSVLTDLRVRPDGKIVAVGFRWSPRGYDSDKYANLLRLTSSGILDTSFGSEGTGLINQNVIYANINSETKILLNSDNTFFAVGTQITGSRTRGFISKFTGSAPTYRYSITYLSGGGIGSMSVDSGTASTAILSQNQFTKNGFVFDGWQNQNTTYVNGQQISFSNVTDLVLTAKWRKIRILFNPNGGTGSMAFQEYDGLPIRLSSNAFSNLSTYFLATDGRADGTILDKNFNYYKVFNGWSTSPFPDLSSYSFENQDVIESLTSDVTLYAKWRDPAVFFDLNGAPDLIESQNLQSFLSCCSSPRQYGLRSFQIPQLNNGIGSHGLRFVGWNTQADGTGLSYFTFSPESSRLSDSFWLQDQKLYAIWNSKPVIRDVRPLSRNSLQINFTPSPAINGRTLKEYQVVVENLTVSPTVTSTYVVPASAISNDSFVIDNATLSPTAGLGFSAGVEYRVSIQSYFGFLENSSWSNVASSPASDFSRAFKMPIDCNTGGVCAVGEVGPGGGTVFYISPTPINGMAAIQLSSTLSAGSSPAGIYLEGIKDAMTIPNNSVSQLTWCTNPTVRSFSSLTAIGTGAFNSEKLIASCADRTIAWDARTFVIPGQNTPLGWFLPSRSELDLLLKTIDENPTSPGTNSTLYWSSSFAGNDATLDPPAYLAYLGRPNLNQGIQLETYSGIYDTNLTVVRAFNPTKLKPAAPSVSSAVLNQDNTVTINFTSPDQPVLNTPDHFEFVTTTGVYIGKTNNSTSRTFTSDITATLTAGQSYQFKVIAVNAAGETISQSFSNQIQIPSVPVTYSYTLYLLPNGASGAVTKSTGLDSVATIPSNPFTRDGFTFAGWTDESNISYANAASIPLTQDSKKILRATWTAVVVPTPPTPTPPAPTPPSSSGGGGGGGGGGGAPKQTALYFQVVDPTDATKIYTKPVCVEIYSRTLFPQFMGTGCSGADGRINVLVGDAKVSIRVFELGNGAVYKEYLGEVANDTFTLDGGTFFAGTTRFAISLPGAKSEPFTPAPTPTPTPTPIATPTPTATPTPVATPTPTPSATPSVTPTPTASPTATKSTFFSTTTSTKNLTKVTLRNSSAAVSTKVGKSLQVTIPTVGTKNVAVKVSIKDPSGKSYTVASAAIAKNKGYVTPVVKFAKAGSYTMTISAGTSKRTVRVKVAP
jgi:uncharacterized delta-60 repeat protein/uncharacterized repeat protein (TIGR02543 family)